MSSHNHAPFYDYGNTRIKQTHLFTNQDLKNIKNGFGNRYERDPRNLQEWLDEMDKCCYIPVYKAQDEDSVNYPFLRKEDFVLVFISKWQLYMLMKSKSDYICIDGIQNHHDGFFLHTMSVLSDERKVFPCAFLISSRIDEQILSLFYSGVREVTSCKIKTKIFISNAEDFYYNIWPQVMYPADVPLFSTWNTYQDWRNNLNLITSEEKRTFVYARLKALLCEINKRTFSRMIQQFVQSLLEDSTTLIFGRYFQAHYFHKVKFWALCYRTRIEISELFERMHLTIKYLYCEDESTKRFDIFINATLSFIKDNLFDVRALLDQRIVRSKMRSIHNLHDLSKKLELSSALVTEWGGFEVYEKHRIYAVQRNTTNCECIFVCTVCRSCIHTYSCTCIEYAVKWKMCKHIHLVLRYKQTYPELCQRVEQKHSLSNCL